LVIVVASQLSKTAVEDSFSIGITATLLASYHLYSYDVTLLLLPVALTCRHLPHIFQRTTRKLIFLCSVLPWFVFYIVMLATIYHFANLLALLLLGFGAVIWAQSQATPWVRPDLAAEKVD
jgi:hypothetical protein